MLPNGKTKPMFFLMKVNLMKLFKLVTRLSNYINPKEAGFWFTKRPSVLLTGKT
jgi:hypothetical protein